jgi:hypothetical protein
MLEDYWLPRREGGRGTEVTTLPGGQTLGQMDDVLYFQKKFLNCLNVPVSRLNSDALFSVGRATEITRDELKFARFIVRIRNKFSALFLKMLEKQLVLKGVVTIEDWNKIFPDIRFDYSKDNYFTELKDAEIAQGRVELARNFQDMAGKYFSHNTIRKQILKQTDEDISREDKLINKENQSGESRWINPGIIQNEQIEQQAEVQSQQIQDMQAQAQGQTPEEMSAEQQQAQQVADAMDFVQQMKAAGTSNRSMQDQARYNQAVQFIEQNKDLIEKYGLGKK